TTKTVEFLAREFQKHFANVPILPTLGNEDAYCGDYKVQPAGAFLSMFAQAWLKLAGSTLDKESFQQSFSRGGYYSMLFSPLFRHRIIVLNSVFFSTSYENACGSKTDTPGDEQLGWLTESLEAAARANEKVWLVMHIPVGINDYNTIRNEAAASAPVEFWRAAYSTSFVELLSKYRQTVQVVFSGHTHMDDFRIIESEKTPLVVNKLIPSISPVFKNNPGFQVYQYDRASGTIANYQTYYLANLSTAGQPTELEQLKWNVEYDFRSAYRQRVMDVSAVGLIARMLRTSAPIQELYMRLYSVSGPPAFDKLTLPAYTCAILHTTIEEFEKCQQDSDDDAEMRKAGETMQPAMNIEMK
ncbi:MAG TPA: hypothetical protein VIS99_10675, partial [Terrimicrobiaceae bacterium]